MKIFFVVLVIFLVGLFYYSTHQPSKKAAPPTPTVQTINIPVYQSSLANDEYPQIDWAQLTPKNWDTAKEFAKFDFSKFKDDDPQAEVELKKMQDAFNNAPIQKNMNGKKITISGYMVPLDVSTGEITDFLLVPFFGACIHVPPPPANQIIHVVTQKNVDLDVMGAITVQGVIQTTFINTPLGSSGYLMDNPTISAYEEKK